MNIILQIDKKIKMFNLLGGVFCVKCGINDIRTLQLDHKYGGGKEEIKEFGDYDKMLIFYFNNPNIAIHDLQVLCANCNWIKRSEDN